MQTMAHGKMHSCMQKRKQRPAYPPPATACQRKLWGLLQHSRRCVSQGRDRKLHSRLLAGSALRFGRCQAAFQPSKSTSRRVERGSQGVDLPGPSKSETLSRPGMRGCMPYRGRFLVWLGLETGRGVRHCLWLCLICQVFWHLQEREVFVALKMPGVSHL